MKRKLELAIACIVLLLGTGLSSCIKKDLPEFASFDANEITLVNAEYRFNGSATMNGQPIVAYQKLNVTQTVDKANATINLAISVPAASGQFTAAEKAKVAQSNLWFYLNISTAATVSPTGGTPALGDPTDATKALKYVVTAANGTSRVWTINITSFTNN
ncbi:DUF5018-related domain-containing protein [Pedobacter sp. GSP4]|uniref:DUF5018-related domain-containing protein n=1 Tax=Pedobacter sp. GSP4 TaxID=3453716 RepID=UPI003EEB72C7